MTPLISWLIIGGIALTIFLWMNALYIDSLKREIDNNKPPF
jgi:hypothetical protein